MPRFPIEDVEDAYAYYVLVLGMPENTFWGADVRFVRDACADKAAYDAWLAGERAHISEQEARRAKAKRTRSR